MIVQARGHFATAACIGRMPEGLFQRLSRHSTKQTTSQTTNQTTSQPKTHQVGPQNPSKIYQVGAKIHQDGGQNRAKSVPRCLWEASWAGLGAKRAPRAKSCPKQQRWVRPFGCQVGAKIHQKSVQRGSKMGSFFL